ncbi:hypothetical protein, partial [Deinococcus wulumuqiensis]|uniref:hypothetical protein n=1 Tax=Deinococcus wulumuqiensis TaxID=980427 RepID=UPI0035E50701
APAVSRLRCAARVERCRAKMPAAPSASALAYHPRITNHAHPDLPELLRQGQGVSRAGLAPAEVCGEETGGDGAALPSPPARFGVGGKVPGQLISVRWAAVRVMCASKPVIWA